jgi:hypothetical protein
MRRALRKEGGIILTVPQHPFLWSKFDEFSHHVRRYRARDLKSKIERAGFRIVAETSFVSLLFPLVVLSRLSRAFSTAEYDGMADLKQAPTVDFCLGTVMDLERLLIRAGVSFPVGGSLLMAARKM